MIAMGIDPGLRATAVSVIDEHNSVLSFLHAQTIHPPTKEAMPLRLAFLFVELQKLVKHYKADVVVVEEVFVSVNAQTSLKLSQARAICLLAPALEGQKVIELSPRDIKKSVTGSGKADKIQMQSMIKLLLPCANIHNEHEADALAMAIAGMHYFTTHSKIGV